MTMLEPHTIAAELDFTPELVDITSDEPFSEDVVTPWSVRQAWRITARSRTVHREGFRRVRRGYVLRPLPMREVLDDQETFRAMARAGTLKDLAVVCAVIVGPEDAESVLYLPLKGLEAIRDAYRRVNELGPADEPALDANGAEAPAQAVQVALDTAIRRLQRAPFNLRADEVMELTMRQVIARFEDFGEQQLEELQAEAAIRGVDLG